jgi:pSer/pThr/pTyr-binding forkhead associated (FHA) protein
MWRIIALDKDAREVARAELTAGEVSIGRDPDRQLQLNSASVSRRHARIVANGAQLLVFDDGSANGIMVNGNRVGTPTPVDARSKIEIADFRIVVESTAAAEATPSVAPFATASVAESLRLVAQGGPYDARVFPVIGEVMVGRAAENQLVLDDPSLSRKHARLQGNGHRLEVEDQGSSNGTFVNGRKVGRALAGPGDMIRFGELSFRIEDERGMGRPSNDGGFGSVLALVGGGGVTIIILITAMVVTLRKPPVLQASGKDAIAKIAKQAEQHLKAGKARFDEKKWVEAKSELDATIELDPANVEARRMKAIAAHAPEDERELGSALNALGANDRRGIETALRLREEILQGSQARQQLDQKLTSRLIQYGLQCASSRDYADTSWALCRAYEIDPAAARSDARVSTELHEAEKRLTHDRGFVPCRAAR